MSQVLSEDFYTSAAGKEKIRQILAANVEILDVWQQVKADPRTRALRISCIEEVNTLCYDQKTGEMKGMAGVCAHQSIDSPFIEGAMMNCTWEWYAYFCIDTQEEAVRSFVHNPKNAEARFALSCLMS